MWPIRKWAWAGGWTNIDDTDCAVITSIDIDHTGISRARPRSIPGREKAGIMRAGRPVVSDPVAAAKRDRPGAANRRRPVALWAGLQLFGRQAAMAWAGRGRRYAGLAYRAARGQSAHQRLGRAGGAGGAAPAPAGHGAGVRLGLAMVELPGRFQIVPGPAGLVLDVAHNPHSVAALTANLDAMGDFPDHARRVWRHGRQGSGAMLAKHRPPDRPLVFHRPAHAARQGCGACSVWNAQRLGGRTGYHQPARQSRAQALRAASAAADPADRIVVFGSFYTVGGVLGTPRLHAKHLGA